MAPACSFRARGGAPQPREHRRAPFEGSFRQLRGAVVEALRTVPAASLASLSRSAGVPFGRVAQAVRALALDGLVRAGPAALDGRPRGRVSLAA